MAAALVAVSALGAHASDLPEGEYSGLGDGTRMTMTVSGGSAKILMAGSGCVGAGTGAVSAVANDRWLITMTQHGQCLVDLELTPDGYDITARSGGSCASYGGQACGFYGLLTKE